MAKDYGQLSSEISGLITKLQSIELQAQSIRSSIAKLVAERQAIEAELQIGGRVSRNSKGPKQTQAARAASAELRDWWRQHKADFDFEFRESGPIPAKVKAAAGKK